MTEEEKLAWNKGYAEGYRIGKRWAEGRIEGKEMSTTDVLILAAAVLTIAINTLSVFHIF